MYKKYGNKLWCFSPPVMLATLLIEFFLAFYTVWRYRMTIISRLVFAILIGLGLFQLAEYMICGGLGLNHVEWAKTGYVAITILPALGIHLIAALAKAEKKAAPVIWVAYATAAAYVAYFLFAGDSVIARECAPNYAIFDIHGIGADFYTLYYYGWLFVAVAMATYFSRQSKKDAPALTWAAIGYATFIIPTTFANLADPTTLAGIPSIMCGFAVLLALVFVGRVLPLSKTPLNKTARRATKRA